MYKLYKKQLYIYSKRFYIINATNVVVVHNFMPTNSTSVNFEGLYVYLTHSFQEVDTDSIQRETVKQKQ